jgi:hypothetical protein
MARPTYPPVVREIARAATDAVAAARAGDLVVFAPATQRLAGLDPDQVGLVLGAVSRSLLEDLHPDGLSGEDAQAVISRCASAVHPWFPDVDPNALLLVLSGAMGVFPADEEPIPVTPLGVAQHAPLLVADLLAAADQPFEPRLHSALAEIARAQTTEHP